MEKKTLFIILVSVLFGILFLGFSMAIKDTKIIWLQTRIFGMISFFALFLVTALGELRVLTKGKLPLFSFRFHKPLGIFSIFVVLLHGISGMMDSYQWGKGVPWTSYLGFSFGDKWLTFLSFGTLAFYLMVIVGMTSQPKVIQKLGYAKWKLVHYLGYAAFGLAYVHSVNLGTDLKGTAPYMIALHWIVIACFIFVLGLLLTRIVHGLFTFDDIMETGIAASFFVVLIVSVFVIGGFSEHTATEIDRLKENASTLSKEIEAIQNDVITQSSQNQQVADAIVAVKNG